MTMAILSLKEYLQQKNAGGLHGVRWCAPGLSTLSLRSVLRGIRRRIIHLSDLHIGLNESPIPSNQVQLIVDAIIRTYRPEDDSYESPRPIIVITGDVVDFSSPSHLDTAYTLFDRLTQHGFTVLVVPGNHDYSTSFGVDTFTPLEAIPGIGDLIKLAAALANLYISHGQDCHLVSGLTFDPPALAAFQTRLSRYLYGGPYLEAWKANGAVYDLDFLLLDGQDRQSRRPDWDDPREFVRRMVRETAMRAHCPSEVADAIAEGVSNLSLDPLTIGVTAFNVTMAIVPQPAIASAVAKVAATWAAVPPLDARFFLRDGNFRLAHGYLDATQEQTLAARVTDDSKNRTLPIVCIHYWLDYPKMDLQYNINNPGSNPDNSLVNERPALWDVLDQCRLLLVGHIHQDPKSGASHTFQTSTRQNTLRYYSRAGSTSPDPIDWSDDHKMRDRQKWLELTMNLNSGEIAEACLVHVDGTRTPLPHDR